MADEHLEPTLVIEKLTQAHSVAGFECSNVTLDTWLQRFAWMNQRAETAKTYVAHRDGCVIGYHALVAGSVLKHEAPERVAQSIANHPVGVILLARLVSCPGSLFLLDRESRSGSEDRLLARAAQ